MGAGVSPGAGICIFQPSKHVGAGCGSAPGPRKQVVLIDPREYTTDEDTQEPGGAFRPLIFGESLFDHFPDGSRVLGGAPFNVAWHLRGFKADPLMVTAVGRDEDGEEILQRMRDWGMDTSGVQVHPSRPTGRVTAHLDGDQPHYDIEARQAYDAIAVETLPHLRDGGAPSLLYHGTLGLREATSASTLAFLRRTLETPTLVDVNLRDPWWDMRSTPHQIRGSSWVKLNREEAGRLSEHPVSSFDEIMEAVAILRARLDLGSLIVTMGAEGSLAATMAGVTRQEARTVADTVDTVGAGDAFSAVVALGIHHRWPKGLILERASDFAGELCRIRGAIPEDAGLYERYLRRWNRAD